MAMNKKNKVISAEEKEANKRKKIETEEKIQLLYETRLHMLKEHIDEQFLYINDNSLSSNIDVSYFTKTSGVFYIHKGTNNSVLRINKGDFLQLVIRKKPTPGDPCVAIYNNNLVFVVTKDDGIYYNMSASCAEEDTISLSEEDLIGYIVNKISNIKIPEY